jgi:hypothetical protein
MAVSYALNQFPKMRESFLAYLWKHCLFSQVNLRTHMGEKIVIIHPGFENTDSGPDFLAARIRINNNIWVGNVEIHVYSSDWHKHGHQQDEAYDNVILHVVYEYDQPCFNSKGLSIPQLVIRHRLEERFMENCMRHDCLHGSKLCQRLLRETDNQRVGHWLNRMLTERLARKSSEMLHFLHYFNGDWEQLFHFVLARSMGLRANALAFGLLAQAAPVSLLRKYRHRGFQSEALLFGLAGLLDKKFTDPYPAALKKEFCYIRKKRNLFPLKPSLWRFSRLRPSNFPTVRIAQFSAMVTKHELSFRTAIEASGTKAVTELFRVRASAYWDNHYRFEHRSAFRPKLLGIDAIDRIVINAISPLIKLYGEQTGKKAFVEKGFQLLREIPPERNAKTQSWINAGLAKNNAAETQALLEWEKSYCRLNRCLHCMTGLQLATIYPCCRPLGKSS